MAETYVPKYCKGGYRKYLEKENHRIREINEKEKGEKRTGDSPLLPNPLRTIHDDGDQSWHSRALRKAFMNSPNNKKEEG